MKNKVEQKETKPPYFALGKPEDIARTAKQVRQLVQPWYTEEELFDLKVDLGLEYINDRIMPPDVKKTLQDSKGFWDWFNAVWHITERKMLAACERQDLHCIAPDTYECYMRDNIGPYQVNAVVMGLAEKEAQKLNEAKLLNNN